MTPEELLRESADFFETRNSVYGSSHLQHGKIMAAFFPNGIKLETEDDFYLFHIFDLQVVKMNRIANHKVMAGKEHADSHLDLTVYSAMATAYINNIEDEEK